MMEWNVVLNLSDEEKQDMKCVKVNGFNRTQTQTVVAQLPGSKLCTNRTCRCIVFDSYMRCFCCRKPKSKFKSTPSSFESTQSDILKADSHKTWWVHYLQKTHNLQQPKKSYVQRIMDAVMNRQEDQAMTFPPGNTNVNIDIENSITDHFPTQNSSVVPSTGFNSVCHESKTFDQFNPNSLFIDLSVSEINNQNTHTIIIGRAGEGKTHLLCNLIDKFYVYKRWCAIFFILPEASYLSAANSKLREMFHRDQFFFKEKHDLKTLMADILETAKHHVKKNRQTLLIVDDVLHEIQTEKLPIVEAYTNGRHYGLQVVSLFQNIPSSTKGAG